MNLEGKVKTLQDLSAQMNQREETLSQLKDKDTLFQQKIALIEELENKIKDIEEQNAYFENDLQTKLTKAMEQKEKYMYSNDALENANTEMKLKMEDLNKKLDKMLSEILASNFLI